MAFVILRMFALLLTTRVVLLLKDSTIVGVVHDVLGRGLLLLLVLRDVRLKFHTVGIVLSLLRLCVVLQFGA